MASEIKLQRLKENVDSYEVTELLVSPGQAVAKDQPLLVVNADKSNLEVYAPLAGTLVKFNVKVGDEIKTGGTYCVIEPSNGAAVPLKNEKAVKAAPVAAMARKEEDAPKAVAKPIERRAVIEAAIGVIPASPATRWLARKLDVDLRSLAGSGTNGRITEDDVRSAYGGGGVAAPTAGAAATKPLPNFEQFGPVQRDPLTKTRRLTAAQMHLAWSTIPAVTQHDLADVTDLEAFRKSREGKGVKLTVTAFALKAIAIALKLFPTFNSSLDLAGGQLILKKYVHVGVAVDTKAGLLVPVLRDVDKKGVEELAAELNDVAERARGGKADMSGGCFTITNLGGIGGTAFTPIVNWPEVAILGLSRGRMEPVWRDGAFVPRLMLPLSLSYDHRVIDGADAARFTRRVAEMMENPWMMVLHS